MWRLLAPLVLVVCIPTAAFGADEWTTPYPGVEYLHRTTATPQHIFVLEVDLTRTDIRLRATRSGDRGQVTSSFAAAYDCEIAVNADFYASGYKPIGLAVGAGEKWSDTADSSTHGFVAAGRDNRVEISHPSEVVDPPEGWMADVVGGNMILVWDGEVVDNSGCGSFCDRNPRTAAGLTADGNTLILAVVDGRSTASVGATLNELADLMHEMGAWQALNLDGGGSSTMFISAAGGVVNTPSDGSERVVANHLGVCIVPPFGTLTGFVREGDIYDTEAGVAGAEVQLSSGQSAVTAADGRYTIEDVPAGEVSIAVSADGLAGERTLYVAADDLTWGSVALLPVPDAGVADAAVAAPDAGVASGPDGGDASTGDPADDGTPGGGCGIAGAGRGGIAALPVLLALLLCVRRRRG